MSATPFLASASMAAALSEVVPVCPSRSEAEVSVFEVDEVSPPSEPTSSATSRRSVMFSSSEVLRFET